MADFQSGRRITEVFVRLLHGEKFDREKWLDMASNPLRTLSKTPASKETTKVARSQRVFDRDFEIIRQTLQNWHDGRDVIKLDGVYQLIGQPDSDGLTYRVALAQILLGSRAFPKVETEKIINELTNEFSPDAQKRYFEAIKAARNSYEPLSGNKEEPDETNSLLSKLDQTIQFIKSVDLMTFHYQNSHDQKDRTYHGLPVTLYFDTFYFYVVFNLENHVAGDYTFFRLDHMTDIYPYGKKKQDPNNKFHLQDQRHYVNLLPMGEQTTFQFKCWISPSNALDRFPSAHTVKKIERGGVLIEARALEDGALLWLQSQGDQVQVVSPQSFVEKIKKNLEHAAALCQ